MIVVEDLSKIFNDVVAVDEVSFQVKEGQNLVLLGTSGCGKTTTLRMINRLVEPSTGQIYIDGQNILTQPADILRRSIGYVLQHNGLFPHYTVAENIGIVPQLLGWDKKRIKDRTIELLNKLQLDAGKYLNSYPHELSGGQQQRVGLARALAADPPILLMDEPFGALDPITRVNIRQEFQRLDELKRKTIILVTHDVEEAFSLGDKICLMDKGKIVQNGTPAELLFKPSHEFVLQFIGSQQVLLKMKVTKLKDLWSRLEDAAELSDSNYPVIDADQSIWDTIELFQLNKVTRVVVAHPVSGEKKAISSAHVLDFLSHLN